jgi:hypothetical protein
MKPHSIPTPPELMKNPELAVLAVLDATLDVAWYALAAEHPDMHDEHELYEQSTPRISLFVARHIIELMDKLHVSIDRYRQRLKDEQQAQTEDLPF